MRTEHLAALLGDDDELWRAARVAHEGYAGAVRERAAAHFEGLRAEIQRHVDDRHGEGWTVELVGTLKHPIKGLRRWLDFRKHKPTFKSARAARAERAAKAQRVGPSSASAETAAA